MAERRLAAIMFTDIVGYTALMARDEDAARDARDRHEAIVRPMVEKYQGQWIERTGDETLSAFPSALDAVNCALAAQAELDDDADLRLRVGIHHGDVTFDAAGVSGDGVNVAARVRPLAEPGGICITGDVHHSVRGRSGLAFEALGEQEFRNVDHPVAVYSVTGTAAAPRPVSKPAPVSRGRAFPRAAWAVAALVVIAIGAGWWLVRPSSDLTPIRSIAVLPLENLSGDPEQEYFADGMTEALISELAKIRSIKVISRTSAMRYKHTDQPLTEIASELGVDAIIEGSVFKSGDDVRITAQLVHGGSDEHLWAESYTESLVNVLQLQADVALAITREIRATVTPEEERRLISARSVDPKAQSALLKGRHFYNRFTRPGFERAAQYFREALEHDPSYAEPFAWLSLTHWAPSVWGWARPDLAVARSLANEALRLDPESAAAHTSVGWMAAVRWDWGKAERSFRRAIELDPSLPDAYLALSDLLSLVSGRADEAIAVAKLGQERDPLAPIYTWQIGFVHLIQRDYDAALQHLDAARELGPVFGPGFPDALYLYSHVGQHQTAVRLAREDLGTPASRAVLAFLLARAGEREEARRSLAEALEEGTESYLTPSMAALAYAALGDEEEAIRWLEREVTDKGYWTVHFKRSPLFDPFRDDPRFDDMLRRIGFPES